jgi:hypothetical protein
VLKRIAVLLGKRLNPECALKAAPLNRLLPAGRVVAEIGSPPSALAGRINCHAALPIAHQPDQLTFWVNTPADNTGALRDVL